MVKDKFPYLGSQVRISRISAAKINSFKGSQNTDKLMNTLEIEDGSILELRYPDGKNAKVVVRVESKLGANGGHGEPGDTDNWVYLPVRMGTHLLELAVTDGLINLIGEVTYLGRVNAEEVPTQYLNESFGENFSLKSAYFID